MLDTRRNTLVQLFICGDIAVLNSFAEYLFPNLECLLLRVAEVAQAALDEKFGLRRKF